LANTAVAPANSADSNDHAIQFLVISAFSP
jgi:hypothetical protein